MPELKRPDVSIVMPAFNAEQYISDSIKSVQNQIYDNWELIVVDDGSTDNTFDVVKGIADYDNRIKLLRQENGRQGKARNAALQIALGEWIAFLDADDLWLPEKLAVQMKLLKSNSKVDLVYTSGWIFNTAHENNLEKYEVPEGLQDQNEIIMKMLKGWSLPILSVTVRRNLLASVSDFGEEPEIQNAEDYQLWLKLADKGIQMYGIREPLFKYRVHPSQATFRDGVSMYNALWALKNAGLSHISDTEKQKLIESRLDRYILHNIDDLKSDYLNKLINLYAELMGKAVKKYFLKFILIFGRHNFKRVAYRIMDSTNYNPEIAFF